MATTTYTFTPNAGQCATKTTLAIQVNNSIGVAPISGPVQVCISGTAQFSDATPGGSWASSDEMIASVDASGNVRALNIGTVTITYSLAGNCPGFSTTILSISPIPSPVLKNKYLCIDKSGNIISAATLETGFSSINHTFTWTLNNSPYPAATSSITTQQPGNYSVVVTDTITGCTGEANAVVGISSIAVAEAGVGNDFEDSQNITINVTGGSGVYEFELNGGMTQDSNVFTHIYQGEYDITVRDKNGCGELELKVFALNYPRFFTPNGDGYNDFWNIRGLYNQPKAMIYIFDRYGKLITNVRPSDGMGWNGRYNGQDLPSSDYWFTLKYTSRSGEEKEFKSHFSLKR